jgi:hypothetical protein
MRLSDAFRQVEVELPEAQAIITSLAKDLSDGNPVLYAKIIEAATNMTDHDDASASKSTSTSKTVSG